MSAMVMSGRVGMGCFRYQHICAEPRKLCWNHARDGEMYIPRRRSGMMGLNLPSTKMGAPAVQEMRTESTQLAFSGQHHLRFEPHRPQLYLEGQICQAGHVSGVHAPLPRSQHVTCETRCLAVADLHSSHLALYYVAIGSKLSFTCVEYESNTFLAIF